MFEYIIKGFVFDHKNYDFISFLLVSSSKNRFSHILNMEFKLQKLVENRRRTFLRELQLFQCFHLLDNMDNLDLNRIHGFNILSYFGNYCHLPSQRKWLEHFQADHLLKYYDRSKAHLIETKSLHFGQIVPGSIREDSPR
jgi:hypothetical protein